MAVSRDLWPDAEPLVSIVIARFDDAGHLLHGNAGLRRLHNDASINLWQLVTRPSRDSVMQALPDAAGRLYSGLLTVSNRSASMVTLRGSLVLDDGQIWLIAGYDMDEFEALSAALLALNDELSGACRALARSKRELELREQQIRVLSLTDALTGVGNRRRLDEALVSEAARASRYDQPLALLILDIDHFKRVNDTWGHDTGDRVLKETGTMLLASLRESDIATRMGGEEFVVLLPATGVNQALASAERLREALGAHDFNLPSRVTASFGVACLEPGESGPALLARADGALYTAKQQGRNRVVAAAPAVASAAGNTAGTLHIKEIS